MIKKFFKEHSIHKVLVKRLDWIFAYNLPKFLITASVFSWGMASAYFQVNQSSINYFNTNFDLSNIIIFLGLFLLMGGLNIQIELNKLKYVYDSTALDYVKDNNNLDYPILASHILNEDKMKKLSFLSIFLGVFIIGISSINIVPTILLYSYLNLFYYKNVIRNKNFIQNIIFLISTNFLLFLSGWIYNTFSFGSILEYIPIYILAILPIILSYEFVFFKEFINRDEKTISELNLNGKKIYFFSILMLLSVFYISYNLIIDPVISHFALIILPFYIFAFFRGLPKDFIRSFIYPIMVMNILLSWTLFPYLFVFILIVYFFSKYYYWHRFDMHFPKFVIEENI